MSNLYNDFRPKLFDTVVGQDQSTLLLKKQMSRSSVSHSLLFHGPSGTGKTTTARILAAVLCCQSPKNGEPCNECDSCRLAAAGNHWDIREINCADLRGIDDMRQLCYQAYLAPYGLAKVFILDEVHMLTKEAQNALLKLLEEPPDKVYLILCTSEPSSLLPTLKSRCMIFAFNKLPDECVKSHLAKICVDIGVMLDTRTIDNIVRDSDGNLRSGLNRLQQLSMIVK